MPKLGPRGKYKLTPTTSFKDGPNVSTVAPQGANPLQSKNPDVLFTVAGSGQQLVMEDLKNEQINVEATEDIAQPLPAPSDLQVRAKMEMPDEIRESGHPVDEINVANVDLAEQEQVVRKAKLDEEFKNNQYELMKLLLARLGGGPLPGVGAAGGIANAQSAAMAPSQGGLPFARMPASYTSSPGPLATYQASNRFGLSVPSTFTPISMLPGAPVRPRSPPSRAFDMFGNELDPRSGQPHASPISLTFGSSPATFSPVSAQSQIASGPPARMANIFNLPSGPYGTDP